MAMPNLMICSVTCSAQSNYRNYATPKERRPSHSGLKRVRGGKWLWLIQIITRSAKAAQAII